ncbi:MAG: hypothetical protein Q8M03_11010 [Legionella sp.]|nr:hypothetical protein [Legionella sp.]
MSEEQSQNELSGWFSTYGLITAQRILERYKINLQTDDLLQALKTPDTFYHRLMRVPLRNVYNGIILQQARDYQLYAQKIFIDYLLSNEGSKSDDSPGANTREDLEEQRKLLVKMSDNFHELEFLHEKLIAQSQATLIKDVDDWHKILDNLTTDIKNNLHALAIIKSENTVMQALITLLASYDFKDNLDKKEAAWQKVEKTLAAKITNESKQAFIKEISKLSKFASDTDTDLADYHQKIKEMGAKLRQCRTDLYNFIVHANELIKLLPDYRVDLHQMAENREALQFDYALGGTSETDIK